MEYQVVMPDLTEVGRLWEIGYATKQSPRSVFLPGQNRNFAACLNLLEKQIRTHAAILTTGSRESDKITDALRDCGWKHSGALINYSEWERGNSWMILWTKLFPNNSAAVQVEDKLIKFDNRPFRMGYCCGGKVIERSYWKPVRNHKLLTLVRVPIERLTKAMQAQADKAGFRNVLSTPLSEYYCNSIPEDKFKVPTPA